MMDGDTAWRHLLLNIIQHGEVISPRGQDTLEILHSNTICVHMDQAVVTSPARKINYRFMCAEALWILNGENELAPLTRFVKRMTKFSDDGETLAGAYGPRIKPQLAYVVSTLLNDRDTRQATLSIWTPKPEPSKDIPCTVAMVFSIRNDRLYQHVFMRSSDGWLGIPYDIFSFSCIGMWIVMEHNSRVEGPDHIIPGHLTISMTSSHLYQRDLEKVFDVLRTPNPEPIAHPGMLYYNAKWETFEQALIDQREGLTNTFWRVVP